MKLTRRSNARIATLSLAVALTLATGASAQEGPFSPELLEENLQALLSPNDKGGLGAGDKDSAFRLKLGLAVLRGDLKMGFGWNGDPRGKGNDDLTVDFTSKGVESGAKDAKKAWLPELNFIAGGAVDLDFGTSFEAVSVEYKKNLLEAPPKEFFKPKDENAKESSALQKLFSNDDLTVKVAGFTVRCSGPETPADALGKQAFTNGGLLKNGLKLQFWAGCVPILVRGNAGMSLGLNLGPTIDLEHAAFGGELEPGIYLHGWLAAGVGGAVGPFSVCAGVAGKLRLVDTTVKLEGGVCLSGTPAKYGSIKVEVQPLSFQAQLFVHLQAMWLARTFTWTIFKYSMDKWSEQYGVTPRDEAWGQS